MVNTHVTNETLDQAVDAIMKGIDTLIKEVKGEMTSLSEKMRSDFTELKAGQSGIKRQLNDLKADTPTRKVSDDLKDRV